MLPTSGFIKSVGLSQRAQSTVPLPFCDIQTTEKNIYMEKFGDDVTSWLMAFLKVLLRPTVKLVSICLINVLQGHLPLD